MFNLQTATSTRSRTFVFQVLVIFIPLALVSCAAAYYLYYSAQDRLAIRNRVREEARIEISRDVLVDALQNIRGDLDLVSGNFALKNFLDRPEPSEIRDFEQDMLNLSASSRRYDQIRWIDETGMERVRVNYNNGSPEITPAEALQNKSARFYFPATFGLKRGEVFISRLDLNIEHKAIEIPYKPILRFGTPVFDSHGDKRGIVILNVLGAKLLARLNKVTADIAGHVMLLNQEGYWLKSPKPEQEWGFMFGRDQLTLAQHHPAAWQRMLAEDSGQFEDAEGLWTFNTIYSRKDNQETPEPDALADRSLFWKIVAQLPQREFISNPPLLRSLVVGLAALLLFQFAGSWKLAQIRRLRDEAQDHVVQTNQNLEQLVKERTLQLQADIELRKQAEIALQAKKSMLDESQRIAHIGSWQLDMPSGKITFSEEAYRIYGISPETFTPDLESVYTLIHADDLEAVRRWVNDCLEEKHPGALEYRAVHPDGSIRFLCAYGDKQFDSGISSVRMFGTLQDITQQKQAEVELSESAARIHAILDTVVDGIITIDKRGIVETFNPAAEHIFGYNADEVIGRNVIMLMPEPYHSEHDGYLEHYLAGGEAKIIGIGRIVEGQRKDGSQFPLELTVNEMQLGEQRVFTGVVRDITERKNADDKLKNTLNEKEMLLKEVYHRVKNNLQVVSSLINLQARNVKNKEAVDLLKQSADRIKSMALLHEKLYQSKDLARINFNDYIRSLADHLLFGYGAYPGKIKVSLKIGDVFLDVDTAIPCGLIINELLSNALKHAFPDDRRGEIDITLTQDQNGYILVIADNGTGFPEDMDFRKNASLGLQLVSTLTGQLMGQMDLDQTCGSAFTIRFPKIS